MSTSILKRLPTDTLQQQIDLAAQLRAASRRSASVIRHINEGFTTPDAQRAFNEFARVLVRGIRGTASSRLLLEELLRDALDLDGASSSDSSGANQDLISTQHELKIPKLEVNALDVVRLLRQTALASSHFLQDGFMSPLREYYVPLPFAASDLTSLKSLLPYWQSPGIQYLVIDPYGASGKMLFWKDIGLDEALPRHDRQFHAFFRVNGVPLSRMNSSQRFLFLADVSADCRGVRV